MNLSWQRFLASLTPGVRLLLCLLVSVYLASVIGRLMQLFDLSAWLTLTGPKFREGQAWRLMTYALIPYGILDLIMNCLALVMLGGRLERFWSRGELWTYCAVTTAGAGLAKVALQPSSPVPLTGAAPMIFGLLAAWVILRGRERLIAAPFTGWAIWQLVLIAGGISFLLVLQTAGLTVALVMAAGGLTGFLYLWVRLKWLMSRAGRVAPSERMSRLEL